MKLMNLTHLTRAICSTKVMSPPLFDKSAMPAFMCRHAAVKVHVCFDKLVTI